MRFTQNMQSFSMFTPTAPYVRITTIQDLASAFRSWVLNSMYLQQPLPIWKSSSWQYNQLFNIVKNLVTKIFILIELISALPALARYEPSFNLTHTNEILQKTTNTKHQCQAVDTRSLWSKRQ